MDEGKFDASNGAEEDAEESKDALHDMYSKGGLLDILGVEDSAPRVTKMLINNRLA
jgi:hypothetical protein